MDTAFGPVPVRREVDAAVVRRLIADQFPRWAGLPVRPVAVQGWDNRTFRLGDDMLVRMPTAAEYALAVGKEHRWLPVLAPQLPLPIPRPLALGAPGAGFEHFWSVYAWQPGEPASSAPIADRTAFALTLAGFVAALQRVDAADAPAPGVHNWFRGGPLSRFDGFLRAGLDRLDAPVRDAVTELWEAAVASTWTGPPVWFHGDLAPGNLLVRDGALAAVIDFGTCGAGDPACDLAICWTLLSPPARRVFRECLAVDDGMWLRGRGWALWKAVSGHDRRVIDEILAGPDN